jgi:hypothetical protein
MRGRLRRRGRGAGLGDDGQVAGLRTRGKPRTQVRDTLPGRIAERVAPERLVGDQIPDRRQVIRRGGRQGLHRPILPVAAPYANDPSFIEEGRRRVAIRRRPPVSGAA